MGFVVGRKVRKSGAGLFPVLMLQLSALVLCLLLVGGCGSDDKPTDSDCQPIPYTSGQITFSYGMVSYDFQGVAITDSFDPLDFIINPDVCGGAYIPCEEGASAVCYGGTLDLNLINPMSSTVDLVVIIVSDTGSSLSPGTYSTKTMPLCAFGIMEDVPLQTVLDNLEQLSGGDLDANDIDLIFDWMEEFAEYTKFNVFGGSIECSIISSSSFSGSLAGLLYSSPEGGISFDYAGGTFSMMGPPIL